MNYAFTGRHSVPLLAILLCVVRTEAGLSGDLELVSTPPWQTSSTGGAGSWGPVMTPDGRFVLFSSLANNLLTNSGAIQGRVPPVVNVFCKDRQSRDTVLLSVNSSARTGGNGDSWPQGISSDGRYALFESSASDLVPGDTNEVSDVFVRDLLTETTILVSANTNGTAGNGSSQPSTITPDGRYVAFVSDASDLVPNDTNQLADVFVRDVQTGTTVLVSVGAQLSTRQGRSDAPQITPDGRFVAFYSTATNLVQGVPLGGNIYVRDLANDSTTWASSGARSAAASLGLSTNLTCYNFCLSDNGRYIAYEANSWTTPSRGLILRYDSNTGLTDIVDTNSLQANIAYEEVRSLDMTPDGRFIAYVANTNGPDGATTCVYVWDGQSGLSQLASGDLSGAVPTNSTCRWPVLDDTGRYVAFLSSASNLTVEIVSGEYHLYRRDLQTGVTTLIDRNPNGTSSGLSAATSPRINADGNLAAFEYDGTELFNEDGNRDFDVFIKDLGTGAIDLISARDVDWPSVTPNGMSLLTPASISFDGRFMAFATDAENLSAADSNQSRDVYWRDRLSNTNRLISSNTNGSSGDSPSAEPAISQDGSLVAFTSLADDLVPGDTNHFQDVFLRDLNTGTLTLVSVNQTGTGPGNKASYSPMFGVGGRFVLFRSRATNLAPGAFSGLENLFVRDLELGTNYALTSSGVAYADLPPGGRFVTYSGRIWDLLSARTIYINSSITGAAATSPDGRTIVYWLSGQLLAVDRIAGTTQVLASGFAPNPTFRFSSDGNWLAYAARPSTANTTNQVYLCNLIGGTNVLVSHGYSSLQAGIGNSDSPAISPDARFVVYRSSATDVVPGVTAGVPQIFVYDSQTGLNSLLSSGQNGASADGRCLLPVFSADGQTLVFGSAADNLVVADFNQNNDLFAYTFVLASIVVPVVAGQGPWISWPTAPGHAYGLQFKDSLTDALWQDMTGTATNAGLKAWQQDPAPATNQRFYRIRTF